MNIKTVLLPLIIFFSLKDPAFAQKTVVLSPGVKNALVFRDRVQLSTNFELRLPEGTSQIELRGLANSIDQGSIGVKGKGDLLLLSVDFEPDFISNKRKVLEDSIQAVESQIEDLELQTMALNHQLEMVMDNTVIKAENEVLYKAYLDEMSVYFKNRVLEIGRESLAFKRKIKVLKEKQERLKKQLETDIAQKQPLGKIILTVKANSDTQARFELDYIAFNAGWSPYYDVRVADTKGPLDLSQKARVFQNTGVDWEGVKLTLSTAAVHKNGVKPELLPQYLSFYKPRPVMYETRALRKTSNEEVSVASDAALMTLESVTQSFDNQLSTEYRIELPYTVISGKDEDVNIRHLELPAEYATYLVPARDRNGFLLAEIKDWSKHNLLNAEANVYFEGAFVGKSYIQTHAKDEPLKVSLGRDERIIAERKEIDNFKSRRVLGSNIRESFGYEIKINNTKRESVKVWVEDQVPVSKDSGIEVEIEDLDGGSVDPQTGIVKWFLELPATGTKQIELKYEVKYPKDKQVGNL